MSLKPGEPWLVPFLSMIRARPGMYIGSESVDDLDKHIFGYTLARQELGFPAFGSGEENLLKEFEAWLRLAVPGRDAAGWAGLIGVLDPSRQSMRTFLRLFDQFLQLRGAGLSDALAESYSSHWWNRPIRGGD